MEKDDFLKSKLKKRETSFISEDFELRVMQAVKKEAATHALKNKYLFLIWAGFAFGLVTGILVALIWVDTGFMVFGVSLSAYKWLIQMGCAVVLLLLFDKIYRYSIQIRQNDTI